MKRVVPFDAPALAMRVDTKTAWALGYNTAVDEFEALIAEHEALIAKYEEVFDKMRAILARSKERRQAS